jgi:hypothetical protein
LALEGFFLTFYHEKVDRPFHEVTWSDPMVAATGTKKDDQYCTEPGCAAYFVMEEPDTRDTEVFESRDIGGPDEERSSRLPHTHWLCMGGS